MSYDFTVQRDRSATPAPLGTREEVLAALKKALPGVAWRDPSYPSLEKDGWAIVFSLNDDGAGAVESLSAECSAGDSELTRPLTALAELCRGTGWAAWDRQTGSFLQEPG